MTTITRQRRQRGPTGDMKVLVDKFLRMKPGQSFFVQGANRRDLEVLRKWVIRAGVGMTSVEVKTDEIFQTAGVRAWRLHGPYDEEL